MSGCAGCGNPTNVHTRQRQITESRVRKKMDVKIVYTGDGPVKSYFTQGILRMFGDTDQRRVGAVPIAFKDEFLKAGGKFYGSFEEWGEETHSDTGMRLPIKDDELKTKAGRPKSSSKKEAE